MAFSGSLISMKKDAHVQERKEIRRGLGGKKGLLFANTIPSSYRERLHDIAFVLSKMLIAKPARGGEDARRVEVEMRLVGGVLIQGDASLWHNGNVSMSWPIQRISQ